MQAVHSTGLHKATYPGSVASCSGPTAAPRSPRGTGRHRHDNRSRHERAIRLLPAMGGDRHVRRPRREPAGHRPGAGGARRPRPVVQRRRHRAHGLRRRNRRRLGRRAPGRRQDRGRGNDLGLRREWRLPVRLRARPHRLRWLARHVVQRRRQADHGLRRRHRLHRHGRRDPARRQDPGGGFRPGQRGGMGVRARPIHRRRLARQLVRGRWHA